MQKNAIARTHAPARKPFTTPNKTLYGRACGSEGYAVFSYGEHWPLFVFDGARWYANGEKRSVTTSAHYGQANPGEHLIMGKRTTDELRAAVRELDARA